MVDLLRVRTLCLWSRRSHQGLLKCHHERLRVCPFQIADANGEPEQFSSDNNGLGKDICAIGGTRS